MKEKEVLVLAQIGRKLLLILLELVVEATEFVEVEGDMEVTQTVSLISLPLTVSCIVISNRLIRLILRVLMIKTSNITDLNLHWES